MGYYRYNLGIIFLPTFVHHMKIKTLVFYTILFFCTSNIINAQTDTAFWFVAPEVTSSHGDRPIYLRFTTLNQPANITITQPANASFAPISITIPSNTSLSYDLTPRIDAIENKPANQILNFGLYIRSSAFITAYYEAASVNNPEIFALKGRNALGTSFFIPTQTLLNNSLSNNPASLSGFEIVATEDGTTVTITPTQSIVGNAGNTPITLNLNKGQTYSAIALGNLVANHLTGSTVTSNKPIAITIKDDSIGGGSFGSCSDLAGEQIVPITVIGTKYISLPGYLNVPTGRPTDNIFILATEDNTTVHFNNNLVTTLNKGQTFMQNSFNDVFYIEASKPVYVLHLSGFGCEVGHALLPQLECSGSRTVGFTRSLISPLYVNILVPNGGETDFTFNGDATIINATQFSTVPFTNGIWKYARIQLSTSQIDAGGTAIVKNSSKDFHLSIIHGDAATGGRYGYFSGFNKFDAVSFSNATNNNPGCNGDTLKLFCDVGAAEGITFSWTGPNGFISSLQNPVIPNIQTNMFGTYTAVATKIGCTTVSANTSVIINTKPTAFVNTINPVCAGETVNLLATTTSVGATFSWTGPNGYVSNNQNNTLNNISTLSAGNYILQTSSGGCIDLDTIVVAVKPKPSAQITGNLLFCKFSNLSLNNNNTILPASYNWGGPNNFTSTQQNVNITNIDFIHSGKYYLLVTGNNGCSAIDSFIVNVLESPVINFDALGSFCTADTVVQINAFETTGLAGNSVFTGNGINATGLFNAANAGVGNHLIKFAFTANNGCVAFKEQPTQVFETPIVNAGADKTIIQNSSTILNGNIVGTPASILWTPNYLLSFDTVLNPIATPQQTTTYKLTVISSDGCFANDDVEIKVLPKIEIPNAFSPNGDGTNDIWEIPALTAFPKCTVQVFDRNGRTVYSSRGYTTNWDGKLNGKNLPVAIYYYMIQLNDDFLKSTLSGSITLIK